MSSDLRHRVVQQVVDRPKMVREFERHRRRTGAKPSFQTGNFQGERLMGTDEIVVQAKPLAMQKQMTHCGRPFAQANAQGSHPHDR